MYLHRARKFRNVRFFTFLITPKCSVQVIAGLWALSLTQYINVIQVECDEFLKFIHRCERREI